MNTKNLKLGCELQGHFPKDLKNILDYKSYENIKFSPFGYCQLYRESKSCTELNTNFNLRTNHTRVDS